MNFSKNFNIAIKDYKYFLERKYPQKSILKLVGDKYMLTGKERAMLFRGITTNENIYKRKNILVKNNKSIKNKLLHIDGYNVLITVGSYLNGNMVFICNDNFLRDVSELHGKIFRNKFVERSLKLTLEYLNKNNIKNVEFYLDKPISKSGELCREIRKGLIENNISGDAQTCNSPDYILKNIDNGIVCSSDSTIIDNSNVGVFDLARKVILFHFKPKFVDLRKM
ncbi:MAG: DUF434 domain-containing protein [Bacteroidales bacterium]|nr:DUF434 domain-containing protein [Bacteroidales bacterium]